MLGPFRSDRFFNILIGLSRESEEEAAVQVLVPICCFCEKVRDDNGTEVGQGRWVDLKIYHAMHHLLPDEVWFSHTCCPDCRYRRVNVRALG